MKTKSKFKLPKIYAKEEQGPRTGGKRGSSASGGGRGQRKRPRRVSDYGVQLKEKQKVRYAYGLREQTFRNYVIKASAKFGEGSASSHLYTLLESRLDSVAFRMGLTRERESARQIVSHGHVVVNGRRVTVPSYQVRIGDIIAIREQSRDKGVFNDLDITLKKYSPPAWIELDADKRESTIIGAPSLDEAGIKRSLDTIIEFYSR